MHVDVETFQAVPNSRASRSRVHTRWHAIVGQAGHGLGSKPWHRMTRKLEVCIGGRRCALSCNTLTTAPFMWWRLLLLHCECMVCRCLNAVRVEFTSLTGNNLIEAHVLRQSSEGVASVWVVATALFVPHSHTQWRLMCDGYLVADSVCHCATSELTALW